ncbi:unnamed protein product [Rhizophagus irregularis]|nr:unnamed protein product [Rhizophagus irregularis]
MSINLDFKNLRSLGCVTHPFKGHQGRRKTLNLVDLNILDSLVKDKKDWYLDEMLQKAAKERNGFIAADIIEGFLHKCYLK